MGTVDAVMYRPGVNSLWKSVAVVVLVAGCAADSASFSVDLRTDLVPREEFMRIEVELQGETVELRDLTGDFLRGRRLATFDGLTRGATIDGEVRLYDDRTGAIIARPLTANLLSSNTVMTVVVTRDCREVICPGAGPATATACLGGRCGDPRCSDETPEFCEDTRVCEAPGDCAAADPCSDVSCELGACFYADGGRCPPGEYCDPARGCSGSVPEFGDYLERCPESASPLLDRGVVIGFESDALRATTLRLSRDATAFVEQGFSGVAGAASVTAEGEFVLEAGAPGAWDLPVQVETASGIETACVKLFILSRETIRYLGGDWTEPSSFDPPGVPGAADSVLVETDAALIELPMGAAVPRELYVRGGMGLRVFPRVDGVQLVSDAETELDVRVGADSRLRVGGRIRFRPITGDTEITTIAPTSSPDFDIQLSRMTILGLPEYRVTNDSMGFGDGPLVVQSILTIEGGTLSMEYQVAGGELTIRDGTPVYSYTDGGRPEVPHVTRFTADAVAVIRDLDAANIDMPAGSFFSVGVLNVTGTLTINRPMTVQDGDLATIARLVPGPLFSVEDPSRYEVALCEPGVDAPPDICTRYGW